MSKDAGYGWCQNLTAGVHDPFESQKWQKGALLLKEVIKNNFQATLEKKCAQLYLKSQAREAGKEESGGWQNIQVWLVPILGKTAGVHDPFESQKWQKGAFFT